MQSKLIAVDLLDDSPRRGSGSEGDGDLLDSIWLYLA